MELDVSHATLPYVGRERELGVLLAMMEVISASGGMALLAGEPGIGKTRTAEEAARQARAAGLRVLWGRCWEGAGAPPFWPWVEVIRGYLQDAEPACARAELSAVAPVMAQLVPELHEVLGAQPALPELDPDQARFRLFDGLAQFLTASARNRPLLIVLDDLHWADTASLLQLQFLARDLRNVPLLLLGTYRDGEVVRGQPLARTLADLARSTSVVRVSLHGLTEPDVARLIAATGGTAPARSLVEAVTRETDGNPFFITEVVRLLAGDSRIAGWDSVPASAIQLTIPHTVREATGRRLDLLSETCTAVLTTAAVLGRVFQLRTLEAVIAAQPDGPFPADAVLDALEEAEARGIVEAEPGNPSWFRFSHILIRDILYEDLTSTRRMRLHRLAGEVLERLYGVAAGLQFAELASHFVHAAPARDLPKAVRYERWAGDHALTIYAYEEAAEHYASALHVLDLAGGGYADAGEEYSPANRCDLVLNMGTAQRMAGDVDAARNTFLQATDLARGLQDVSRFVRSVQGFAGDIPQQRGGDALLLRLLDEALQALAEGDSHDRAMLLTRQAIEIYYLPDIERGLALGYEAAAMARRLEDESAISYVLRFLSLSEALDCDQRLASTEELVKLAIANETPGLELVGHCWRAVCLLERGDAEGADAQIAAYAALAERLQQPTYLAMVQILRAMQASLCGRLEEAEILAERALESARRAGRSDALTAHASLVFVLRIVQGRLDELEEPLRGFIAQNPAMPVWRCALAYLYAETERRAEANEVFEALAAAGFVTIPRDNLWLTALSALAECCAFLDDQEHAVQIYDLLLPFAGYNVVISGGSGCTGSVARALGLLAATLQRWEDAERHFEAALAMNARIGAVPWLAITQYNYAAMLHAHGRDGDRERAAALLAEARATADELGMATLTRRGAALASALQAGATPPTAPQRVLLPDGLSAREADVLRLIAAGLSNREVAERLVLSIRTVETHLNRAYAKIGARGRGDAIAYVFRSGLN